MNWKNTLARKLEIDFPFVQAPMLGVTTPEMVAGVSTTGSLGSLPLGLMRTEQAATLIHSVKNKTSRTFSVNLFVYKRMAMGSLPAMTALKALYKRHDAVFPGQNINEDPFPPYEDLIDLLIQEDVRVISFTFGIPDSTIVTRLKSNGCILIGSASSVAEARMIEDAGLDVVVAQGIEAGGHRFAFADGRLPQTGLISLLPQVVDAVRIPVIAAGGLMEGRSISAAFTLGAQGVQLGSAFLRCRESMASQTYKRLVAESADNSTVLTNAWTGRFARALENNFTREMQNEDILPYPYQIYYTAQLREKGKQQDSGEIQSFWAGQACRFAKEGHAAEIMPKLIKDTEEVMLSTPAFH